MNCDQNETTSTPTEPKLCRMGCGFFGSNATGDCCSKCWNDMRKKEGAAAAPAPAVQPRPVATPPPAPPAASTTSPAPMEVDPEPAASTAAPAEAKPASTPSPTKKKKKKKGYKNLLAGMMEGNGPRDAEKEKDNIKKVTGGGAFVKIDKI